MARRTVNTFAGLDSVSGRAILLDKKQFNDLNPADRDIVRMFQSYAFYPHLTVAEIID